MPAYHLCLVDSLRSWGGAELWFLETARALTERGYRVSLVTQPDAELRRRALAAGVPVHAIPIRFDGAPWTLVKLYRLFRTLHVTALVANLTKDLKASAVAGRLAGVPVILASRESDFPLKNKAYYRWYFTRLATGVLVNSRATARTVLDSAPWLAPERVHLLYKGIDTERFCPRPDDATAPAPDRLQVGFAGQLIARKGLADLQAAWERLLVTDTPPARLFIAGQGPLAEDLDRWRTSLIDPDSVALLGHLEDMPAFYRDLDVLVMPSLAEGFGLAAAEASACGVPVIATDTSSLPEIVRHRETGLLVPTDQPEHLAAALAELLADAARRREMGLAARRHIVDNFDQEACLQRLLKLTGAPPDPTSAGA